MRTEESNLQLNQFQATAFQKLLSLRTKTTFSVSHYHLLKVSQANSALFSCSHILQLQKQHLRKTEECNETKQRSQSLKRAFELQLSFK